VKRARALGMQRWQAGASHIGVVFSLEGVDRARGKGEESAPLSSQLRCGGGVALEPRAATRHEVPVRKRKEQPIRVAMPLGVARGVDSCDSGVLNAT